MRRGQRPTALPTTIEMVPKTGAATTDAAIDDADVAAGNHHMRSVPMGNVLLESAPSSVATINTNKGHPMDLEFFEDLVSEPVLVVLGVDISHLPRQTQFVVCAAGVFGFSLFYGFLQELIAVNICNRKLGLFQAVMQFTGYTVLAYVLRNFVYNQNRQRLLKRAAAPVTAADALLPTDLKPVPLMLYLGLSLLRAIDLAMTNLAMQYINYPAKTLMKSSRVVFTMLFGILIQRKRYHTADYLIVLCMVGGLALFMHADANSSAVFHHTGVIMLVISLVCDGAISNVSETIMKRYGVGQDEVRILCFSYDDLCSFSVKETWVSYGFPLFAATVYLSNVLDCLGCHYGGCGHQGRLARRACLARRTGYLRRVPTGSAFKRSHLVGWR